MKQQPFQGQVYLFENKNEKHKNHLKSFLYYLRYKGQNGIIDFSYSGGDDSLHLNLTIKENILLDSIPMSLNKDNENNLLDVLGNIDNKYLKEIINDLGDLNIPIKDLSKEKIHLASFIKTIIAPTEFVFLIMPESIHLTETIGKIKNAINYEAENRNRTFFIMPKTEEIWLDTASYFITQNQKSFEFNEEKNLFRNEKSQQIYDFKLIKNVA